MAVRAHDHHVELARLGHLADLLARVTDLGHRFGVDAVACQELRGRAQHFFSFFAVVVVGGFLAHHAPCMHRQLRLHGQQRVAVGRGQQLLVCDQISQHFFGVGAAIDCEQDFHGVSLGLKSMPHSSGSDQSLT